MNGRASWVLAWACAALLSLSAAPAWGRKGAPLPLRRVRLYETGVGYFERTGVLRPGAGVVLPVPAGHLDDALKTLVVLSRNGKASVSGIDFGSSVSRGMARALAGLPAGDESPIRYGQLLGSLKGAAVEVRTAKGAVRGRLVDVLRPQQSDVEDCVPTSGKKPAAGKPCELRKRMTLLLLTDRSEIRRLRARDVVSLRPLDPSFSSRLGSALDALSSRGAQTTRNLRVLATKGANVTLGYVAETPLWRSTYRLVLDAGAGEGTLQGWALIHNDTDEDWKKVRVELVNGRPDSFLFPLAAPLYARRELVTPSENLSTVPQLFDKTVGNLWGEEVGESYGTGGLGLSGVGEGGSGSAGGIGLGGVGTTGHGGGVGASSLLDVGDLAHVARADGVEAGALFRYALRSPVDLRAHGSALVPFLQERMSTRRIAFFDRPGSAARSALRFENASRQTLPAGPIAIFADGGFAGESALDRLEPKEVRIVRFGFDLDVELTALRSRRRDEVRVLSFRRGDLVEHFVRKHEIDYRIVNRSGTARTVYLALAYVSNSTVAGADSLDFDVETSRPTAVFEAPAREDRVRELRVREGLSRSTPLGKLTSKKLRALARLGGIPKPQKAVVLAAADELQQAEIRRGGARRRGADLRQLDRDIERLREHVEAVGSKAAVAAGKLADRLLEAEDAARRVRRRIDALEREAKQRVTRARRILGHLDAAARPSKRT